MTFHNINENRPDITGHFGSGQVRNFNPDRRRTPDRSRSVKNIRLPKFSELTVERWVDIICISIILIFLVSVFLNWNYFLDSFFINVLFPIISVGAKLLGAIVGIGAVVGVIYAKLRRPKRWY